MPTPASLRQRLSWLVGASLLCAASLCQAVQDCELNGEHVNPANGNTTAGKTGLMRCKERDTGELRREQELRNGVFMGVVRYYDKGRLSREHSVNEKGNRQGLAREFAPSGQLLSEANHENGSVRGLSRNFYPNGQLRRVSFHADGNRERASAEFTEQGKLAALQCADAPVLAPALDDARLCGHGSATPSKVEIFDSRGRLRGLHAFLAGQRVRMEELHDNGQPALRQETSATQRTEQRFNADGTLQREASWRITERGSIRQREAEFSARGTLVREQRWAPDGELLANDTFYLNGQPRSQDRYSGTGSARELESASFHDNGQRSGQGRYNIDRGRERPTGVHERFDDQGKRLAESTYDTQGRLRRERSWDKNGQMLRDDEVFEDGSRKAYTTR